jgi:hypothetical protein
MITHITSIAIAAVAISFSFVPLSAQKFHFEKGKTIRFVSEGTSSMSQSAMGEEVTLQTRSTMYSTMKGDGKQGENVLVSQYSDSLAVQISGGAMMGLPDTTLRSGAIAKHITHFTFSPKGEVINTRVEGSLPPPFEQFGEMSGASLFGNQNFRFVAVPDSVAITPGATWKKSMNNNVETQMGTTIIKGDALFEVIGKRDTLGVTCFVLKMTGQNLTMSMESENSMGKMSSSGDMDIVSTMYIEESTGIPVFIRTEGNADIRASITGQMDLIMTITLDMNEIVKRI